jgi:type II pantothenate kinase
MLGVDTISHIEQLCEGGDLSQVDLRISDISKKGIYPDVNENLTASNFGKLSDLATRHDISLGIVNMVTETVAMMAIFAARSFDIRDIVLTGNLTSMQPVRDVFDSLKNSFGVNFIIPNLSQYGPVIGSALQ